MAAVEILTSLNLLLVLVEVEVELVVEVVVEVVEDVEVDSRAVLPFQQRLNRTVHLEERWEVFQTTPIHS